MTETPPPFSNRKEQIKPVQIDLQDTRKIITDAIRNSPEKKTDTFTFQDINSNSPELTDELIEKFADTFRFTFNNPPYNQYLVYPNEGRPISAHEVFGGDPAAYISLERLEGFDIDQYPPHPETGEKVTWWHDPKISSKKFHEKLKKGSYMTLQRDSGNGDILGASLGRTCTLQEAFEKEEWENPLAYASIDNPKKYRDFSQFMKKIQAGLKQEFGAENISPETMIFCYNCVFMNPQVQKSGHFINSVIQNFFKSLPVDIKNLFSLSEMIVGTKIYLIGTACGMRPVSGILNPENQYKPGDSVIMIARLEDLITNTSLPREQFRDLCKATSIKMQKA